MNGRRGEIDLELPGAPYIKTIFREPGNEMVYVMNRKDKPDPEPKPHLYERQFPHQHWRKAKPKS